MVRLLFACLVTIIVSGFIFPFELVFFPGINSKMVLAAIGLLLFVGNGCKERNLACSKEILFSIVIVVMFSIICLVAINYNDTNDYTYVTYLLSFFVWLSGAYTVCCAIKALHGTIHLRLLILYLMYVCLSQCLLAITMDYVPAFRQLVDTYINQGQIFIHEIGRLYGIGASLDTAGVRFSVVLVLIAYLLCHDADIKTNRRYFAFIFLIFGVISVLGNMIARTTSAGMFVGLVYIMYSMGFFNWKNFKLYSVILGCLIVVIVLATYFYQTNDVFYKQMRFAFEGFFNWAETGKFRTDSTDKLNNEMWIWPDCLRGWIIGNGMFGNWIYSTDIGYCRFILYCGLIGFSAFAGLFIYNAWVFAGKFHKFKMLSFCLLLLSFIIWMKVATDLFFIYALFYCIDWDRGEHLLEDVYVEELETSA